MTRMEKVHFMEDYVIEIILTDGERRTFDMKPKLRTVRFHDLGDMKMFSCGILKNGQVICWSDGTELSLDEILSAPLHGYKKDKEKVYE